MSLMRYAEFTPAPDLRAWVDRYWLLEDEESCLEPRTVLPDGHPEWVLHLADPFAGQNACLAIGQMTGPVHLRATGPVRIFGVRFRPEGAYAFLRSDQSRLADRIEDVSGILPSWRERVANGAPAASTDELLRGLRPLQRDERVGHAASLLAGGETVDATARHCNWSPRQLERVMLRQVGLPPKTIARLGRFQRALRLQKPGLTWASIAATAGYSDQSHLVRDFRQFAGAVPSSLQSSALTVALVR